MKFKVGDKIKCIDCEPAHYIKLGEVYTVKEIDFGGGIVLEEIARSHSYSDHWFDLVSSQEVLTPEEVFEHLRNGTELEIFGRYNTRTGSIEKWLSAPPAEQITYNTIVTQRWRIKPEPEVIELNGKKYREIVD